ncbi:hypothetical protein [Vulcanisaeta souniana]|uniref:hypothetical protein n=1 Tax=Vulcanisaeta souniana TaxID=164452 RepID=UPI001FB3D175|nr:hypothetical protein [Vulcanisaeta souniana]
MPGVEGRIIDIMRQRSITILDAVNESLRDLGNRQLMESIIYYILRDLRGIWTSNSTTF